MENKKSKTLILNSLVLLFCAVIVGLYCMKPANESNEIAKLQTYKVVFETEDGTLASLDVQEGKMVVPPEDPTREGFIFKGWTLDGEVYDFDKTVSGNMVLKPSWEEQSPDITYYTVSFDTAGGSAIGSQTVAAGEYATEPDAPTKSGYEFTGWTYNGATFDFSIAVNSDMKIVATWREASQKDPNEGKEWTVTFDLNGGTGSKPATQKVVQGNKATVPSEKPTRDKYDFVGWNTNKNATTGNISTYVVKDRNTIFYAIWKSNVKTYKVSINLDGGKATNCKTTQNVEENKSPSGCTSPTRNNYTFNGWTDGTSTYNNLSQFTITKNVTIKATWKAVPVYTYTLTYNNAGGSGCSTKTETDTATTHTFKNLCRPTAPTTLQEFKSWTKNNTDVTQVSVTSSDPNVTLVATYKNKSFSVKCSIIKNDSGGNTSQCRPGLASGSGSGLYVKIGRSYYKLDGTGSVAINTYNGKLNELSVCNGGTASATCVSATGSAAS